MGLYAGQFTEPTPLSGRGVFENTGRVSIRSISYSFASLIQQHEKNYLFLREDICGVTYAHLHLITHPRAASFSLFSALSWSIFCQGAFYSVWYVHILCLLHPPLCRLKCVLIPSCLWLCTTELYKCINAAGMNTFMMHYTPMAQWMRNICKFFRSSFELPWS